MTVTTRLFDMVGLPTNGEFANNGQTVWGSVHRVDNKMEYTRTTEQTDVMPDVVGYGLRDAVCRLEALGLRVKCKGMGRVKLQSLGAGHAIKHGETVTLTLDTEHKRTVAQHTQPAPAAQPAQPSEPTHEENATAENKPEKKPEAKPERKSEKKPAAAERRKEKPQPSKKPTAEKPKATAAKDKKKKA